MSLLKDGEKKSLFCLTVNIPLRIFYPSSQDKFCSRLCSYDMYDGIKCAGENVKNTEFTLNVIRA